ncbi:response regulator transcription factor [bacterium]|nr:response regulator transcription factor [bacterium]
MSKNGKIKVLIADDHQLVRRGIVDLLATADDIEVIEEAINGAQAAALAINEEVDILMLDINMPEKSGMTVAREVREVKPHLPILFLSMHEEPAYVKAALQAGANGYLLKNCSLEDLLDAVRTLYKGNNYFSREITQLAMEQFMDGAKQADEVQITAREKQILKLILQQYSNQEIAEELKISVKTVEVHKRNLIEKTHSKNIVGLIIWAGNQDFLKD